MASTQRGSKRSARRRGTQRNKKVLRRADGYPLDSFAVIERVWEGSTVVCLGGGPSLTKEAVALAHARGVRTIAINNAYLLAPHADVLYFADYGWWQWHKDREEFKRFAGQKCSIFSTGHRVQDPEVFMLHNLGTTGLSAQQNGLCTGNNSGYQAVNFAALAGAKRILLLGFDMQPVDGRTQWHKDHRDATNPTIYRSFIHNFKTIAEPLAKLGVEVINCTPNSALTVFPRSDLESVL